MSGELKTPRTWRGRFAAWSKPRREMDVAWAIGQAGSLGAWSVPAAAVLVWVVLACCVSGRIAKSLCWAMFSIPMGLIMLSLKGGSWVLARGGSSWHEALGQKSLALEAWMRMADFRVYMTIAMLLRDARALPIFRWFWAWDLAVSISAANALRGRGNAWGMNAYAAAWGAQWRAPSEIWPGSGTSLVYLYEFLPHDMELSRSACQPMGWAGSRLGFDRKATAVDHIMKHAMAGKSFAWARHAVEAAAAADCQGSLSADVPSAAERGSGSGHRL